MDDKSLSHWERVPEGESPRAGEGAWGIKTLTLPSLRDGPLPLPQGEGFALGMS
jgi:hypothetical protein